MKMAKTLSLKHKGDALVLQVARNEPVNIKISGSGAFRLALQAEVSAPGSGSWRDIQGWSRKKEDKEDIVYSYSNANEELQSLRLIVKEADEGASISATMEVPAEAEKAEEPKPREARSAEVAPASEASVEEEKARKAADAKAAADAQGVTTTTTTKRGN